MEYRIYLSDSDRVISGFVDEDLLDRIERYQDFFQQVDSEGSGNGIMEVELPCVDPEQDKHVIAKATADEIEFGVYAYEGWERLYTDYVYENLDCTVKFDRMILYHVFENTTEDSYPRGIPYQEARESMHESDRELFDEVMEEYIADRESNDN